MTVAEYEKEFVRLSKYAQELVATLQENKLLATFF